MTKKKIEAKKVVNKEPTRSLSDRISQLIDSNSPSYLNILNSLTALECEQLGRKDLTFLRRAHNIIGDCLRYSWHCTVISGRELTPGRVTLPEELSDVEKQLARKALEAGTKIGRRHRLVATAKPAG
jgi:hypothetical protein